MRLSLKEINNLNLEQVKDKLSQNVSHLMKLHHLENKNVAFYNREVYEVQMNIYNLELRLKEFQNETF